VFGHSSHFCFYVKCSAAEAAIDPKRTSAVLFLCGREAPSSMAVARLPEPPPYFPPLKTHERYLFWFNLRRRENSFQLVAKEFLEGSFA